MSIDDPRIERILAAASRAPSVHNTQPWSVHVHGTTLDVRADDSRRLTHADPAGREMSISCGAFLANLRVAARRESFRPVLSLVPDDGDPALVARVDLVPGVLPDADELDLAVAIERRSTSRVPFEDQPLDADVVDDLDEAAASEGARLVSLAPQAPSGPSCWTSSGGPRRRPGGTTPVASSRRAGSRTIPTAPTGSPSLRSARERRRPGARAPLRRGHHERPGGVRAPLDARRPHDPGRHRARLARGRPGARTCPADRDDLLRARLVRDHRPREPATRAELATALDAGVPQMVMRLGYSPTSPRTPRRPADDVLR